MTSKTNTVFTRVVLVMDKRKEETLMTLDNNTPCSGGCGKFRSILCSDSPTQWLCFECASKSKHFIGGSGEYGCLYDSCGVYHTLQNAVDGLADTFGLGRTRKAKLAKFRHLDLNPGRDGADYCEIQVCNCSTPWVHDEMMTESDWNESLRKEDTPPCR